MRQRLGRWMLTRIMTTMERTKNARQTQELERAPSRMRSRSAHRHRNEPRTLRESGITRKRLLKMQHGPYGGSRFYTELEFFQLGYFDFSVLPAKLAFLPLGLAELVLDLWVRSNSANVHVGSFFHTRVYGQHFGSGFYQRDDCRGFELHESMILFTGMIVTDGCWPVCAHQSIVPSLSPPLLPLKHVSVKVETKRSHGGCSLHLTPNQTLTVG